MSNNKSFHKPLAPRTNLSNISPPYQLLFPESNNTGTEIVPKENKVSMAMHFWNQRNVKGNSTMFLNSGEVSHDPVIKQLTKASP